MKRNRRLLLKTAERIETIPESYDQNEWAARSRKSPCGTVACLAGEIIICSERRVEDGIKKLFMALEDQGQHGFVDDVAGDLAGFDYSEIYDLFYEAGTWPEPFLSRYYKAKTQRGRANAAAALLRYLADGGEV